MTQSSGPNSHYRIASVRSFASRQYIGRSPFCTLRSMLRRENPQTKSKPPRRLSGAGTRRARHRAERCRKSKCPSWRSQQRLAVRAVKGAPFAFTGAKRKPLTEEAYGLGAGFCQEGQTDSRMMTEPINRHRGSGRPLSPATPPYMRVRIRRFGGYS